MIARIIMPENDIRPAIKSLETGTHFMCRRTSDDARDKIGIYQVVSNDPGVFGYRNSKIPAINCATGFIRMFSPNAEVEPVDMVLAPAKYFPTK